MMVQAGSLKTTEINRYTIITHHQRVRISRNPPFSSGGFMFGVLDKPSDFATLFVNMTDQPSADYQVYNMPQTSTTPLFVYLYCIAY